MRRNGSLPNLVIIGAMKSGTSSLHHYLNLHPEIHMSKIKEPRYFLEERYRQRPIEWYQSLFVSNTTINGEASTDYTKYPWRSAVPARMHATIPEAKLIYLVREPLQRILSHYMHNYIGHRETRTLAEALHAPEQTNYVSFSKYYMQLAQYLPYYQPEQILVLATEDLQANRAASLARVFRFLNVDSHFTTAEFEQKKNTTRRKRRKHPMGQKIVNFSERNLNRHIPNVQRFVVNAFCLPFSKAVETPKLDQELRHKLCDVLYDDVQKLRAYTGQSFAGWSI